MERLLSSYVTFELATLVLVALALEVLERAKPARTLDRRRHVKLDLVALLAVVAAITGSRFGLFALLHALAADSRLAVLSLRALPAPAKVALSVVAVDFALYWVHRALHGSLLWRAHEWHHSADALYWLSGLRASALQVVSFTVPQVVIPFFVFQLTALEAGVAFSIGAFFQLWAHANVDAGLGPLDAVLVGPRYHRLHHSRTEARERNLGTIFTVWDRVFGTFVDPRAVEEGYELGVGYEKPAARMMVGL